MCFFFTGIKYNEEKEAKASWDAKQKQLQAIEDARLRELEKDKVKDEKQDSFAEKMVTQVPPNTINVFCPKTL